MNHTRTLHTLGGLVALLGLLMVIPLGISLSYGERDWASFLISMTVTIILGLVMRAAFRPRGGFGHKDGFVAVSLGWVIAAAVCALPFLLAGSVPTFTDAYFEAMSGLTTTGATILTEIDGQPHGILFWRSFLHWLGGMGIVVLFLAILPNLGSGNHRLFNAEVPGHIQTKLEPRLRETAKILWLIYLGFTVFQTILLRLFGMSLFDALTHTFATMGTGGFSTKMASVGAWESPAVRLTITAFMFIAGTNFALWHNVVRGRWTSFFKDTEFRAYGLIVLVASAVITLNLWVTRQATLASSAQDALFQVVSLMTTTGFTTVDYEKWPWLSKSLLMVLMFIGGCSGSTGGAIKVGRLVIVGKAILADVTRQIHPRAVSVTRMNGTTLSSGTVSGVLNFFALYMLIFTLASLLMTAMGLDLLSAGTAVAATLGNVGPGLGIVGPAYTFAPIPALGKWVLSASMLLGRLELYTVLVLLAPSFWRRY